MQTCVCRDHTETERQKDAAKASDARSELNAALSFVEAEILAIPDGKLEKYLEEEAELTPYKKYLEDLHEKKPHALGKETEETLAALGSLFSASLPFITGENVRYAVWIIYR
ncbi:hypothetical protein NCCP133_16800 [Cytobacillus sp. NCCP-133]|nr:hypothetical protein NCCP133_16800 [Cytobacillus sp. NCCP-133]